MKEILELLNQCSAERTVFYCVVAIIIMSIIVNGIVAIVIAITEALSK